MKKTLAFLVALTMLSCTACGTEREHSDSDAAQAVPEQTVSASVEPEETEISSESTSIEETSVTELPAAETESGTDAEDSGYEEAIRSYYTYLSERDIEGILHLTYPDAYAETLRLGAEAQGRSLSEILNSFEDNTSGQIRLESIADVKPIGIDECTEIGEGLGEFRYQLEYIQTHGIESLLSGNISEMDTADIQKYAYHIPEAYIVTCSVIMDTEDGEESDEQILLAYYIEDEGWKIEATMIGYVRKSKQAAINSNTKTIYNAAATVSVEFDIEEKILPQSAIISSDSSREYGIDAALSADFKEKMADYFDALQKFDYFLVIENGTVKSIVCRDQDDTEYIGCYPDSSFDHQLSFEELYESCLSDLD